jgi:hypothetical protein
MFGNTIAGYKSTLSADFGVSELNKWKLGEKELKELLLVSHVRIGVRKSCIWEEFEDETSKSTESERDQAIIARHKHDKARSEK